MIERPSPEEIADLFQRFHTTQNRRLRNQLVEIHIGFAHHIAKRFQNRGVAHEDLRQVALLGLVKAVDRYDPQHSAAFTSFAGRTIEGEIKRHFRDATWSVRVPRSAKEMHLAVRRAADELASTLHRSPTAREVAAHLDVDLDDVVRALAASAAFSTSSLDETLATERAASGHQARLARHDDDLEAAPDRVLVERLMQSLAPRDQKIIRLRYFDGLTQAEIAEQVDVSQMHVSRLLRRALESMRSLTRGPKAT